MEVVRLQWPARKILSVKHTLGKLLVSFVGTTQKNSGLNASVNVLFIYFLCTNKSYR